MPVNTMRHAHSYLTPDEARAEYESTRSGFHRTLISQSQSDASSPRLGDDTAAASATFTISNCGHTVGNLLQYALSDDSRVDSVGYREPHPLEPNIQLVLKMLDTSPPDASTTTPVRAVRDAVRCQSKVLRALRRQWNEQMSMPVDLSDAQ